MLPVITFLLETKTQPQKYVGSSSPLSHNNDTILSYCVYTKGRIFRFTIFFKKRRRMECNKFIFFFITMGNHHEQNTNSPLKFHILIFHRNFDGFCYSYSNSSLFWWTTIYQTSLDKCKNFTAESLIYNWNVSVLYKTKPVLW